jgi:hypothetical protein
MAEEFLATGISQDDAALFRLINENMKKITPDEFNNLSPELKERIRKANANKLAEMQTQFDIGSLNVVKKGTEIANQDVPIETQMKGLEIDVALPATTSGFTVGTIPDVSNTEGYTPLYITPKLKYVEGVSGQISSSKNSSYYTANQGKVQINPKNKNLFDKARAKLEAMGLKKKSFDPATGEPLGLQDTDEMRAIVKPMLAGIFGGAALPAVGIQWFAHGRAQQKAAIEMIKDIEDGSYRDDKDYLNYTGKQLFTKMATTFADPYRQMNTIYGKAGVDGNAVDKFFNFAVERDYFSKETLRDLKKYRPAILDDVLKTYDAQGKVRPDITFYSSEFRDTLPEGSKLFSKIKSGGQTIQETFTTPDGQQVSTGVQSDGIKFAPPDKLDQALINIGIEPSPPSGNQGGGGNEGGGGTIVVGNQTVQTPGSSYEYDSSGRKGFTYGLQEGGPVDMPTANQSNVRDADNLELVNEPQKDKTGVADDVPRSLDEGDFVINAPAVKIAGKSDIEKMINKAVAELQRKGIKLDFGTTAEEIDKAINTLVSNGEVIIPKVLAEQIGYDRLKKINNRGKEEVKEIDEARKEQIPEKAFVSDPRMRQSGGAVGSVLDSDVATGKLAAAGAPGEILSTPRGAFVNIAKPMPTAQVLQQTPIGEEILRPQVMNQGGTFTTTFFNPGNIEVGTDAPGKVEGQSYADGRFAVFQNEIFGLAAIPHTLNKYGTNSIAEAVKQYKPIGENTEEEVNSTIKYLTDKLGRDTFDLTNPDDVKVIIEGITRFDSGADSLSFYTSDKIEEATNFFLNPKK